MSGETEQSVSAWTNDTVLEHLRSYISSVQQIMDERDRRYEQRFVAQEKAVTDALTSAEKAVAAALAAAEKAVSKAEMATEKRFDNVNEFRAQLNDQANTFVPRQEYQVQHDPLVERVGKLENNLYAREGQSSGQKATIAYIISAIVSATAIITAIIAVSNN